ncbi:alpha/beta fold hydrolase [Haloarchaeobius sp. DFWS5]|uniref:alpha/beta fold hydrolase n=1 Tax=Haloarchaeobius sp. DFWS5 TaxID=3446114 RepID=UPI003EBCA504
MTDRPGRRTRRTLLRSLGVAAAVGLAGCNSGGDDTTASSTTSGVPTTTATGTSTDTATETTDQPAGDVTEAARQFVEQWSAGKNEAAAEQFTPQVAAQLDPAALGQLWANLQQESGAFVGIDGLEESTVQEYRAVVVRLRFAQGLQGLRLVFDDQAKIAGLQFVSVADTEWTPPEYVDMDAISTTTVEVDGPGDCVLPGEVTVPKSALETDGDGPPSLVLLGGSGPTDRDGTVGPNKPYRDLAYGLATDGSASLRYDKRTAVCQVDPATLTIDDEYTDDAVAAIDRLRTAPGTDDGQTVVVGHSLGAKLAPRVATRAEGVAGVVLLAPPGRPLHDLVLEQTRYIAELDGSVSDEEQAQLDAVEAAVERVEALDIGDGETVLGGGRAYWESLREYDAFATARDLSVPIFVARGSRDYQVTETDMQQWQDELAGQSDVTFRTYDGLNHLFVSGEGQPSPTEYAEPGHVAPEVVADLATWLDARWSA